jgi:hypothetical protein
MGEFSNGLHEQARRMLADELGGIGSPGDLGGAMIRTGVRISLQAAGPVKTMTHLATQLRQLSAQFPNAWMVVRIAALWWISPRSELPTRTGQTDWGRE